MLLWHFALVQSPTVAFFALSLLTVFFVVVWEEVQIYIYVENVRWPEGWILLVQWSRRWTSSNLSLIFIHTHPRRCWKNSATVSTWCDATAELIVGETDFNPNFNPITLFFRLIDRSMSVETPKFRLNLKMSILWPLPWITGVVSKTLRSKKPIWGYELFFAHSNKGKVLVEWWSIDGGCVEHVGLGRQRHRRVFHWRVGNYRDS